MPAPKQTQSALLPFDVETVTNLLVSDGVAAISIVPSSIHKALAKEATEFYQYEPQAGKIGQVRQQLEMCEIFPTGSLLPIFATVLQAHLLNCFSNAPRPPLSLPFDFNNVSALRFRDRAFGITPHTDFGSPKNVIVLYSLTGEAVLRIRESREGKVLKEVELNPAYLTLIRGIGFAGQDTQVMHEVLIQKWPRHSLGFRQLSEPQR